MANFDTWRPKQRNVLEAKNEHCNSWLDRNEKYWYTVVRCHEIQDQQRMFVLLKAMCMCVLRNITIFMLKIKWMRNMYLNIHAERILCRNDWLRYLWYANYLHCVSNACFSIDLNKLNRRTTWMKHSPTCWLRPPLWSTNSSHKGFIIGTFQVIKSVHNLEN